MSDSELHIIRDSSSQHSSVEEDPDDFAERVQQMKKITKPSEVEMPTFEYEIPQDLQELQEKINRPKKEDKRKKQQAKKNFIPANQLRIAFIIHLFKLYQITLELYDEFQTALLLSTFTNEQLSRLEEGLLNANSLQEKITLIYMAFSQVYRMNNIFNRKGTYEPEEYVLYFAQFSNYYGVKTRLVRAFDLGFIGLEHAFRIKTIQKDKNKIEEEDLKNNQQIAQEIVDRNSQFIIKDGEELENLDDYLYNSKSQTVTAITKQVSKTKQQQQQKYKEKKINDEIQLINQCYWVELFDGDKKEWIPFDPISDKEVSLNPAILKQKLHHSFTYFIYATNQLEFKDKELQNRITIDRIFGNIYFSDITHKYSYSFMNQRQKLQFQRWTNYLNYQLKLKYNGIHTLLKNPEFIQSDYQAASVSSMSNEKDFKYSSHYALASQLSQYQMIRPGATPIGQKFKDEDIFNKEDVITLHSRDKWRAYLRNVEENTIPIKEVTGRFDKTKVTQLYAEWQTVDLKVQLDENNGQLPENQYGNYETFAFPPPKGTKLFRQLGLKNLLSKNNIPFVEAVDGFDSKSSKMFAQRCGYLLYEKDYDKVVELYGEFKIQQQARDKENKRKELRKQWGDLFKAILLKKDLQQKYQM